MYDTGLSSHLSSGLRKNKTLIFNTSILSLYGGASDSKRSWFCRTFIGKKTAKNSVTYHYGDVTAREQARIVRFMLKLGKFVNYKTKLVF